MKKTSFPAFFFLLATGLLAVTAGLRAANSSTRPNILFAIMDDWSYGHASVFGVKWVKTPGFDRVANQGLLFHHAFTPNAKCAPSRSIIITGRNSWQLEAGANHIAYFPAKFKSFVEALGENGYTTGMTGKGWGPGIAKDEQGNTRQMAGKPYMKRKLVPPTTGIFPNDYAGNFEDFLKQAPKDKPWFFWYGSLEPHRGYEYGSGVAKGGKKTSDIDHVPSYWPDNEKVRNDMLDYAFEVEHADQHMVRILSLLEKSGQLDNTIVVFTSDHGMPFPHVKGQAYYHSNHVPLAIMWKNGIKKAGRQIDDYVSFADLAPTFLELAGVDWAKSGMKPTVGHSLTDILFSTKNGTVNPKRDHVIIGKERHDVGRPHDWGYPIRGIIKNDTLYLENFEPTRWPAGNPETGYLNCDGGPTKTIVINSRTNLDTKKYWDLSFGKRPNEELYDLKKDQDCVVNLASSGEMEKKKEKLKAQLIKELKEQGDPRMFGNGKVFDEYPYANKGTVNFYERYMKGEKLKAGWVNESDFEKGPIE